MADGAMGSLLIEKGFEASTCLASLNLDQSALIQGIHREYVESGADIIYTHTFGANREALKRFGKEIEFEKINQAAIRNARSVVPDRVFLGGNMGPTGWAEKEINTDAVTQIYYDQACLFVSEGVDLLILETFTFFRELQAALDGCLGATGSDVPVLVSLTPRPDGTLYDGTSFEAWLSFLSQKSVQMIGVNCLSDMNCVLSLVSRIREKTSCPIVVRPNAGLPVLQAGKWVYPMDANQFCGHMMTLASKVNVIGGCCGTTPESIRKLKGLLQHESGW